MQNVVLQRVFIVFNFLIDFQDVATFTSTVRGQVKLIHKGFEYTRYQFRNNFTKWRCCKCRWQQCKGKAITRQFGPIEMVRAYGKHNHPSGDPLDTI